jgi:hypothetical protein
VWIPARRLSRRKRETPIDVARHTRRVQCATGGTKPVGGITQEESTMNEVTQKLLSEAISKHEVCMRNIAGVHDADEIMRRLKQIEDESWSESQLEVENRPMEYRHLVSLINDLAIIQERYVSCRHTYLKEILALRYAEALAEVTDMGQLTELAGHAHPDLRRLAVLRFQQRLPDALKRLEGEELPRWFARLLAQPSEMANFLSEAACQAVIKKAQALLKSNPVVG